MSDRTPPPETVREKAIDAMVPFIWSLLNKNPRETQPQPTPKMSAEDKTTASLGAAYLIEHLEAVGLTIIDLAALEPGEDDGDDVQTAEPADWKPTCRQDGYVRDGSGWKCTICGNYTSWGLENVD